MARGRRSSGWIRPAMKCVFRSTGLGLLLSSPSLHNTRLRDRGHSAPLSVPYAPPFCWSRFFFPLFQCCLQLLLVSLCLMSTIFSLNDSASVKYAAGYFSILSSPACSPVLYYPISLCTRFFRISSFLSRVAVSPGLDTLPSTT